MDEKKDLRFFKTKNKIINGMVKLLEKKAFDDISVKNICEEAQISRSAFYLHYEDKYNLVNQYQKEFIVKINQEIFENKELTPEDIMLSLVTLLKKEGRLLAKLLSDKGSIEIQNQIKYLIKNNIENRLLEMIKDLSLENPVEKEYFVDYLSGAHLAVLQAWINNGQKETPEELAQIIGKINKFQI